jgi:phosphoribosylformylglycinamidine synthase
VTTSTFRILKTYKNPERDDRTGKQLTASLPEAFGVSLGRVQTARMFTLVTNLKQANIVEFANDVIRDPLLHNTTVLTDSHPLSGANPEGFKQCLVVSRLPGVTDDEGMSAQRILSDMFDDAKKDTQFVFSQDVYWFENTVGPETVKAIFEQELGNPLIQSCSSASGIESLTYVPQVRLETNTTVEIYSLNKPVHELVAMSKANTWALDEAEMLAIQSHYNAAETKKFRRSAGLPEDPTDCEMEILAQTWSEHCKHKEFAADITLTNTTTHEKREINSLFKTYIQKPALTIRDNLEKNGGNWIVKLFSDNAGCVKIDNKNLFVWKVETHNSPSALDPYGGALTGIVGVNRDPMGTGIGGAKLLFNTNVLCFGHPDYKGKLHPGQIHPLRILKGVCKGIEDGGNKSGIPTINGAVVFDDRFRGKPLVFCGTAGVLPAEIAGQKSWEKVINPGDLIFSAGGRVGRDGIHGATFSSTELSESAPRSAVQIGSPFTQKLVYDFLRVATQQGLVTCSTDMGAGGLSSSIGELATISGGANVDLSKVPLKYSGLKPWEIFVSESQERMTLVVPPQHKQALEDLARFYEVEISHVGEFTNSGTLNIRYGSEPVALLNLHFLHEGTPRKHLQAEYSEPSNGILHVPSDIDWKSIGLQMMSRPNIASKEVIIRQYDHEVKGRTIVKPLMGMQGEAPQDAGVMRFDFENWTGVAVSNGICPRYAEADAYASSAGAFDEAVRSIISVGGKLPDPSDKTNRFWSANDNFCVPDSVYHPTENPDGKQKLGKLVMMCEALRDVSLAYGIPMTSGKDSMKNDFRAGGEKISIPPTILYSMTAKIDDVRNVVTSNFKNAGDSIYLVGSTHDEMGSTEFAELLGLAGGTVPQVRTHTALATYHKMSAAHDAKLIASSHDLSDGGLFVGIAECCMGGNLGANLTLNDTTLPWHIQLFSESHSRFVVSVSPQNRSEFERLMGGSAAFLGTVHSEKNLNIAMKNGFAVTWSVPELANAWHTGLKI